MKTKTSRLWVAAFGSLCATSVALAANPSSQAIELFRNRQYNDAIKLLNQEIQGKPEEECGKHFLILGECHFLTRNYEQARVQFGKAKKFAANDADKLTADFRLVVTAYRAGDATALEKINTFVGDNPKDARIGRLLVFRMQLLASKGKSVEKDLEATHEQIYADVRRYGDEVAADADQVLCDFYRKIGQPEKAENLYSRIALNLSKQINDRKRAGEGVPASLEKAADNAALQMGIINLEKKNRPEATKWLESVRYDVEMKSKARLFLAKLAYESGEYAAVARYVGDKDFLDAVPAGPMKSDLMLVLGLAEKARPDGNAAKVEQYLRDVGSDSRGYAQAQQTLADMYREKGLQESAIKAYKNAATSPELAPAALFWSGSLLMDMAAKDAAKADAYYRAAAESFKELVAKYPTSPFNKQVKEKADVLASKGLNVAFAMGDEENLKNWRKLADEKAGTADGAQALLNIMRQQSKRIADEKSGKVVKAPDYVAAAAAADRLLDTKVYTGADIGADNWRAILAETNYLRGRAELASVGQTDGEAGKFVKNAKPERAADFLAAAKSQVNAKNAELVRGIDLSLLEAKFKSDKQESRDEASRSFNELAEKYGQEPQFQRVGLDIAEWLREQGKVVESARTYVTIAESAKQLPPEDQMRLWFAAGSMWSRAGQDAAQSQNATAFSVLIEPKSALALGDSFVRNYGPLQRKVDVKWPSDGKNISGRDALVAYSKASGVPFVFASGRGSVANVLDDKRVTLKNGPTTGADVLAAVLDLNAYRVEVDTGMAGNTPTIAQPGVDPEDPEGAKLKTLEIFDAKTMGTRFKPMQANFGQMRFSTGKTGRGQAPGAILFNVIERVEQNAGVRITWADGIDKTAKLASEIRRPDNYGDRSTCAEVLEASLAQVDLRYRITRTELAPQYFNRANEAFGKIWSLDPKSIYWEKSLIAMALNFYSIKDYTRMKGALRQYLKNFDSESNAYYQQACFWVGWALENEKNYREATGFYARAAEERLVLSRLKDGQKPPTRDEIRALLSNDSYVALGEPQTGELKDAGIEQLAELIRTKGHVRVRLEDSATLASAKFTYGSDGKFSKTSLLDVLAESVEKFGLAVKVENLNPDTAERAIFRLANVYEREGSMDQAIENCQLLVDRYPQSPRRRDVQTMMIGIYRNLKQFGKVVTLLENLKKTAADDAERRRLDYELATLQYDMANYAKAAEAFKACLDVAREPGEVLAARDGLAKSQFRENKLDDAAVNFAALAKDEPDANRKFGYVMIGLGIDGLRGKLAALPVEHEKTLLGYEKLSDVQRRDMSGADVYRISMIYYTRGLIELGQGRKGEAAANFQGATVCPDEFISGDASYRLGELLLAGGEANKAREIFEVAMLSVRAAETNVRCLYALGLALEQINRPDRALERYRQLVERYPLSPYVEKAKARPVWTNATTRSTEVP